MAVFIKLRKDSMSANKAHHKYYAHMVSTGEVGTEELAEAIQENTTFKRGEVRGIIDELVSEMKRHLSVESEGVDDPKDFNIGKNIKRVKCKFHPAGSRQGVKNGKVTQLFGDGVDVKWFPED